MCDYCGMSFVSRINRTGSNTKLDVFPCWLEEALILFPQLCRFCVPYLDNLTSSFQSFYSKLLEFIKNKLRSQIIKCFTEIQHNTSNHIHFLPDFSDEICQFDMAVDLRLTKPSKTMSVLCQELCSVNFQIPWKTLELMI